MNVVTKQTAAVFTFVLLFGITAPGLVLAYDIIEISNSVQSSSHTGGKSSLDGVDGQDGQDGQPGRDGQSGTAGASVYTNASGQSVSSIRV